MIDLTTFAIEAVLSKSDAGGSMMIDFAMEAVLSKSSTGGGMDDRLGKFCNGTSYAKIRRRSWSHG